ncbi:hypothetical protein D0A37_19160 [Microcoleus vaginatus HSN003]|nr:hypothetical protein D0A37_19160 [Microcoleus vaginatus HSN003]
MPTRPQTIAQAFQTLGPPLQENETALAARGNVADLNCIGIVGKSRHYFQDQPPKIKFSRPKIEISVREGRDRAKWLVYSS